MSDSNENTSCQDPIEVPVFRRELGAMLISSVRYALGKCPISPDPRVHGL
jgi:hypothetical protein